MGIDFLEFLQGFSKIVLAIVCSYIAFTMLRYIFFLLLHSLCWLQDSPIQLLLCWSMFSLVLQSLELLSLSTMNFVKIFSCIYWDDHVIIICESIFAINFTITFVCWRMPPFQMYEVPIIFYWVKYCMVRESKAKFKNVGKLSKFLFFDSTQNRILSL